MKKKLFLVLCSCFAGALALSSCGGGGGGDTALGLLEPLVRGNSSVVFIKGDKTVKVTSTGMFGPHFASETMIQATRVRTKCETLSATSTPVIYATYTLNFLDGKPNTLVIDFSDLEEGGEGETAILPIGRGVTVTLEHTAGDGPFQTGSTGTASFQGGDTIGYTIESSSNPL